MSLENAILEHAAAIRELADAIRESASARIEAYRTGVARGGEGHTVVSGKTAKTATEDAIGDGFDTQVIDRAELKKALEDAKAKAIREAKEAAAAHAEKSTTPAPDPVPADDKPLDYMKEVVPVMNEAVKADRPAVIALLATFGAKKGAEVPAAQHRVLLAGCQKIIAEAKAA